jgi:L-2-hydroxyglutarate oxidase LhgO
MTYDFAIIDVGIIGLATAREILRVRPRSSVLIVEKESDVARHQTGHNSGVIHAGIYYAAGSLKARSPVLNPTLPGLAPSSFPSTGIVDNKMIAAALAQIVTAMGGDLHLGAEIISIRVAF